MEAAAAPAVELQQVLGVLGRRKVLIVLVVVACLAATDLYVQRVLPPSYTATATLNAGGVESTAAAAAAAGGGFSSLQGVVTAAATIPANTMATYLWQVTSPPVLGTAAGALQKQGVAAGAGTLARDVHAANLSQTDLITITASGHSPQVAAMANAVAQAFITYEQAQTAQHIASALTFLNAQAAQVKTQIDSVASQVQAAQAALPSTVGTQAVTALQDRLQGLQSAYTTLTTQITATDIAQAEATSNASITVGAPAVPPSAPIGPRRHVYLGLAFLVGLVAGCGLAFLLDQLDRTVKSAADLHRVAGLTTLSVIPYVRRG